MPVASDVPPQEPEYQRQKEDVPKLPPVSDKLLDPPVQITEGEGTIDTGATEFEFTYTVTGILVLLHAEGPNHKIVIIPSPDW